MDKKIANNVILGIFVALGLLGFIFMVFNMGEGKGLFSSRYTLFAKFSEVKGLHYGSEISLSGLRIGTVSDIEISREGAKELIVKLAIDKRFKKHIREDSVALIRTQGVLGDKYVEISIGSSEIPILKEDSFIQTSEEKDLFKRSGSLVEGISEQFRKGGNIDTLLVNLIELSDNLKEVAKDMRKKNGLLGALVYGDGGKDLNNAIAHMDGILKKINNGTGTLGAFVNDPTLYEDLKYLLGGAKRSTVFKYFLRQFVESGESEATPKK